MLIVKNSKIKIRDISVIKYSISYFFYIKNYIF